MPHFAVHYGCGQKGVGVDVAEPCWAVHFCVDARISIDDVLGEQQAGDGVVGESTRVEVGA